MSSVVISGDTSGSVTLQAPAIAGSTTLTLPATSGTVITGPGGVVDVASGGTGASTLTANNVILGNGTSAVQFVAPGASGNVLTSNGTTWTSATAGQIQTQIFTAPGTWTKPASCTQVRVTVISGAGGSAPVQPASTTGGSGGSGGYAKVIVPVSAPVAITVGSGGVGGAPATSGGTSSFGSAVSVTGGSGGSGGTPGSVGVATISTGTNLRTSTAPTMGDPLLGGANAAGITLSLPTAATPYTETGTYGAGFGVSGGTTPIPAGKGGIGGAVAVEFIS